jgi:hypothetical protein
MAAHPAAETVPPPADVAAAVAAAVRDAERRWAEAATRLREQAETAERELGLVTSQLQQVMSSPAVITSPYPRPCLYSRGASCDVTGRHRVECSSALRPLSCTCPQPLQRSRPRQPRRPSMAAPDSGWARAASYARGHCSPAASAGVRS